MEEQKISIETAKLAKEKNFKLKVNHYYEITTISDSNLNLKPCKYQNINLFEHSIFAAPTQSLLQKWLREIHGYNIIVAHSKSHMVGTHKEKNRKQIFDKWEMSFNGRCYGEDFNSYEEALEIGLQTLLKLI